MDGVIIINKQKGFTSHDVVNVIRKKLNIKKVGHTGTLDPNATGVLPILVGKATKISKYLIEHNKTYIATIKLGEKTDTGDSEGQVIETKKVPKELEKEEIEQVLTDFLGKQKQLPPIYSAIKVKGKKLYEYAREGQEVKIEPRDIEIYKIKLLEYKYNKIKIEVECSKGTYIRTLCEDISKKLETVGYMEELQRTKINEFKIENSLLLDDINIQNVEQKLIKIEEIFKEKNSIELNDKKLELFLNGVKLTYDLPNDIYKIYNNKCFVGIGIIENKLLKRDIVI
ncbi:MAG: tRNA pseudouridine(55) synthase TruB [Clostridia bacterium]